jgi:hypothetical protein
VMYAERSISFATVMVAGVAVVAPAVSAGAKVMLAAPALLAKATASRRVQAASVPVLPVVWTVQAEGVAAPSLSVVTMRLGVDTETGDMPVTGGVVWLVTVRVWLPGVLKVAENVCGDELRLVSAGRRAFGSLLLKWTWAGSEVLRLPKASCPVTVKLKPASAVAAVGAFTVRVATGPGVTVKSPVPAIAEFAASVAVMVWEPDVLS